MTRLLAAGIALYLLLTFLTSAYGYEQHSPYDFDADGAVTLRDVAIVLDHVGETAPTCAVTDQTPTYVLIEGDGWPADQNGVLAETYLAGTDDYAYAANATVYPWGHMLTAVFTDFLVPGAYYTEIGPCEVEFTVGVD